MDLPDGIQRFRRRRRFAEDGALVENPARPWWRSPMCLDVRNEALRAKVEDVWRGRFQRARNGFFLEPVLFGSDFLNSLLAGPNPRIRP